jgi:peptidoglycan-associated lipoprotein
MFKMKNRLWINLVMAVLVAGLFLTVSCTKRTVVTEPTTIENQASTDGSAGQAAGGDVDSAALDADKAAKELQMAKEAAAKNRFENQDIHFEYDSSDLSSMAKLLLKEKAAWLKANAFAAVIIEGHCDERGTTEYNLALGERRAAAAKGYLINLGISASRMDTISYGEEQPMDFGGTEASYRKNRRAHFAVK